MRSLPGRLLKIAWSAVLAFLILGFGQGVWGVLLVADLKTTPTIPWAVPVMMLVLVLIWQYLRGKWWPSSTSEARRSYLRANRVSGPVLAWALLAGALSIVALAGYWIVLFQLVKMPANVLDIFSGYPLLTTVLVIAMASLVSPITEEAAFRGYCQVILEREFTAPIAVLLSSVLFHGSTCGPWFPVAQASCVLPRRRGVWWDGLPCQLDRPRHSRAHHWRPDLLYSDLAVRCDT